MEDELIKIWQSSPRHERVKFEKSRLMLEMQSSLDRFHRSIKYRDLMEIIPAIIIFPFLLHTAYTVPFVLSKIGAAWCAVCVVYIIFRLRDAKKHKPGDYDQPYLDYLIKTRDYLNVQKKLLDNVIYWYVGPIAPGVILFFIGVVADTQALILRLAGLLVLSFVAYFLNKRAVKKQIVPRIKKINRLIEVMRE